MTDRDLIQKIKDALGTDEDGDALVEVAAAAHRAEQALAAGLRRLDLPYLITDTDQRGPPRLFVHRYGRKIRIRGTPGTVEFATAYATALAELDARHGPKRSVTPPCSDTPPR